MHSQISYFQETRRRFVSCQNRWLHVGCRMWHGSGKHQGWYHNLSHWKAWNHWQRWLAHGKTIKLSYHDGKVYFHTATEGEKIEDIEMDNQVCFEVDLPIAYVKARNNP